MECLDCGKNKVEQKQIGEKCFLCDFCKGGICEKCTSSRVSATELKVLQLKKDRSLTFFCEACTEVIDRGRDVKDIVSIIVKNEVKEIKEEGEKTNRAVVDKYETQIQEMLNMNKELSKMVEKIVKIHNDGNSKLEGEIIEMQNKLGEMKEVTLNQTSTQVKTYSQATRQEFIIVKPKDQGQKSSVTKKTVEDKIDPSELGLEISRVKQVQKGGVAIGCQGGKNLKSVSESIKERLGADYEVKVPEKRFPKIKIVNLEEGILNNEEELVEKIILQNGLTTVGLQRSITVIRRYKGRQGRENVILEVDPDTYSLIQRKERLSIGWRSYKFFDDVGVIQCFKCWKFGHMSKECRSEKNICPKCTGDHMAKQCQSQETKCSNCIYATEVLKLPNVDYNHEAYDRNCEAYKRIYKELERKVSYPSIYPGHQ